MKWRKKLLRSLSVVLAASETREFDDTGAELDEGHQRTWRNGQHLPEPGVQRGEERLHLVQTRTRDLADGGIAVRRLDGLADSRDGRIDLTLLPSLRDAGEDLPEVRLGFVMVPPVAEQRHAAHQLPADQFAQAVGDVRAGEPELLGDVFGGHRPIGEIEQRLDLRDRTVDAPLAAQVAPAEHELLDGRGKLPGS